MSNGILINSRPYCLAWFFYFKMFMRTPFMIGIDLASRIKVTWSLWNNPYPFTINKWQDFWDRYQHLFFVDTVVNLIFVWEILPPTRGEFWNNLEYFYTMFTYHELQKLDQMFWEDVTRQIVTSLWCETNVCRTLFKMRINFSLSMSAIIINTISVSVAVSPFWYIGAYSATLNTMPLFLNLETVGSHGHRAYFNTSQKC